MPAQLQIILKWIKEEKATKIALYSGDVMVMYGDSRMAWHGVSKILFTDTEIVRAPGRLSITLRKVL